MEAAGITAATKSPAGGDILKDARGRPIGVLRETASDLADDAMAAWFASKTPEERAADTRRQIELAVEASLQKGITSFQDAGESFAAIDLLKQAAADGALGIRLWVMVRDSNENIKAKLPAYKAVGLANHHLTIAAIKKTIDGALGSRGAWMLRALQRLARQQRPEHRAGAGGAGTGGDCRGQRRAARGARHRRPRQPRGARHLRSHLQGQPRHVGLALAHRTRPASRRRRHPALRPTEGDCLDAGHPRHLRRALRAGPARRRPGPRPAPTSGRS